MSTYSSGLLLRALRVLVLLSYCFRRIVNRRALKIVGESAPAQRGSRSFAGLTVGMGESRSKDPAASSNKNSSLSAARSHRPAGSCHRNEVTRIRLPQLHCSRPKKIIESLSPTGWSPLRQRPAARDPPLSGGILPGSATKFFLASISGRVRRSVAMIPLL